MAASGLDDPAAGSEETWRVPRSIAPEGSIGYLVLGPESSGTRLTASLLEAAGCRRAAIVGGDDGPELPLDGHRPVIRRSAPHWQPPSGPREWPDVFDLVRRLSVEHVRAVVTSRDWFAMADSQLRRDLVSRLEEAYRNIRMAYAVIIGGLNEHGIPFVISSYESLVAQPAYPQRLLTFLGLPPAEVEVYDGNRKWYQQAPGK